MSTMWSALQQAQYIAHHRAVLQAAHVTYRQAVLQNNIQGQQQAVQTAQNAYQAIYQNNNLSFQQPATHPALLNHTFQNPGAQHTIQNHGSQPLGNPHAHNAPLQNPAIQNVTTVRPKVKPALSRTILLLLTFPAQAPRRRRTTRKPKPKQPLKDVPFPFMELPVEIRIMIYRLLLEETSTSLTLLTKGQASQEVVRRGYLEKQQKGHRGRQILLKTVHKAKDKDIIHLQPAVLRVCNSIHDEAIPILYSQTLEFEHPVALQRFLYTIGHDNRLLLQHIALRGWQRDEFDTWKHAFASALERLLSAQKIKSIHLDRHIYSPSDGVPHYPNGYEKLPVDHFNGCVEFWVQSINAAKGKGTARSILTFADRNFGSEDEIAQGDQQFLDRKKTFMENLKLE
ncbi:unnamed protein product [Aureobasidium vineae]|uniref:DUF7730 domain-containing protein n=1 Tax=Aureobasidium vineae TaxID=2773715 RepID=A0A9N8J8D4_9PEZI|nr:unnamed protein product [Aureobasidium vineae]